MFATIATVLTPDTDVNETPPFVVPEHVLTISPCGGVGQGAIFFGIILTPVFVGLFIIGIGTLVTFCFIQLTPGITRSFLGLRRFLLIWA